MRKILTVEVGVFNDITKEIDLTNYKINKIWTICNKELLWKCGSYDPYTGKLLNYKNKTLEDLTLKHRIGVFLEDEMHDWNICFKENKTLLFYATRIVEKNEKVEIILELEKKI